MFSPHTGSAGFWLGGSYVTIKFDWEGLSRLQGRFGEEWLTAVSDAARDLDAMKLALAVECIAQTPVRLSPSFVAGLDDASLVIASNLQAALGAAFSGPESLADERETEPEAEEEPESAPEPREERPTEAKWIEDAFASAVAAGIAPDAFWRLTPYQTRIAIQGASERLRGDQRLAISAQWYGELFARQKKLPDLATFFAKEDGEKQIPDDATPEQAVAIFRSSLGGERAGS